MPTWFWVAYGLIGLVCGYFVARSVWKNGTADMITGPNNGLAALAFWLIFGATWVGWGALFVLWAACVYARLFFDWAGSKVFR